MRKMNNKGKESFTKDFQDQGKSSPDVTQSFIAVGGSTKEGSVAGNPLPQAKAEKNYVTLSRTNELIEEGLSLEKKVAHLKDVVPDKKVTGLIFQAALKFLGGASLLESSRLEIVSSMDTYMKAAQLFQAAADRYNRCNEMAMATLAYKCMEIACMRITYSTNWNELQIGVQSSDNQGMVDKVSKADDESEIAGDHIITAENLPKYETLLDKTRVVFMAMEATGKYQEAFAAAKVGREDAKYGEGLSFVQRVVESSFNDIEGFLCLVEVAIQAIGY